MYRWFATGGTFTVICEAAELRSEQLLEAFANYCRSREERNEKIPRTWYDLLILSFDCSPPRFRRRRQNHYGVETGTDCRCVISERNALVVPLVFKSCAASGGVAPSERRTSAGSSHSR